MKHGPNHLTVKPATDSDQPVESALEKQPVQRAKGSETSPEAQQPDTIDRIRRNVAEQTSTRKDKQVHLEEAGGQALPLLTSVGKDLRQQSLQRTLKQVRQGLPMPQRALSHIIHQPGIEVASELGGKTVARPSGIIGGGVCAFVGTLVYLYLAKHTGFRYNYLIFGLLFVGGFMVGLIFELIIWLALRTRRS